MSRLDALQSRVENRHGWASSKGESHAIFKALKNKKKLPTKKPYKSSKDPEYAKLTIDQYEAKYPTFKD